MRKVITLEDFELRDGEGNSINGYMMQDLIGFTYKKAEAMEVIKKLLVFYEMDNVDTFIKLINAEIASDLDRKRGDSG